MRRGVCVQSKWFVIKEIHTLKCSWDSPAICSFYLIKASDYAGLIANGSSSCSLSLETQIWVLRRASKLVETDKGAIPGRMFINIILL